MEQSDLDAFDNYLDKTKGLMPRTRSLYLNYYKMIDLDILQHQEYIDAFVQDHGNNSVVRGMMLNLLQFKGLNKKLELPPVQTGKPKKRIVRSISHEEINKLRSYFYKEDFKKGLIFDLIYQGALRRLEIPTIKINSFRWIEWFDNPTGFCKLIVLGKGNKERTVLIDPETAFDIINFYSKKYPTEDKISFANANQFLFINKSGKLLTEKSVYYIIKRGSIRSLGRDVRPHELRHARATEFQKRGLTTRDIKNYLGHSNIATTEIYLHQSEKESLETIENNLMQGESA